MIRYGAANSLAKQHIAEKPENRSDKIVIVPFSIGVGRNS